MKKTILCLVVAILLQIVGNAQKISELPAPVSSLVSTDIVAVVTGGVTSRARLSDLLAVSSAITALTGDVTATGPGSVAATIANRPYLLGARIYTAENTLFTNVWISNMPSGDNTILTAPVGYRMICSGNTVGTTNDSVTTFSKVLTNGNYFRLTANASSITTNVSGQVSLPNMMFDPGESYVVNTDKQGLHGLFSFTLISTNVPSYSPKNYALVSGNNTIYTAATNIIGASVLRTVTASSGAIGLALFNASGALRTYSFYLVPPGDSPSVENILVNSRTVADVTALSISFGLSSIPPGYSLVVNSDSSAAGQVLYCGALSELPYPP